MPSLNQLPPLIVLHGNLQFLKDRYVSTVTGEANRLNWRVEFLGGGTAKEETGIQNLLSETLDSVCFFGGTLLVVLQKTYASCLPVVDGYLKDPPKGVVLLVHSPMKLAANSKWLKRGKTLGKHGVQVHNAPAISNQRTFARDFCLAEAKRYGKTLTSDLAESWVTKVGTELVYLAGEVHKAALHADSRSSKGIELQDIVKVLAIFGPRNIFDALDCVKRKDPKRLAKMLMSIKQTHKKDPTMGVLKIMSGEVTKWMLTYNTWRRGFSDQEAAKAIPMNPWAYKLNLQVAERWQWQGMVALLALFARTERSILSGGLDPWSGLFCGLIQACQPQNK